MTVDKAPTFTPRTGKKSTKVPRQVFLEPDLWEALTRVADFTTEAWKKVDPKNLSISRNSVIETFLRWAEQVYWDDKGDNDGQEPKSEGERSLQLSAYAARLKRQEQKATESK